MASRLPYGIQIGVLFVLYAVAAQLGLTTAPLYGVASPTWPPAGLAVAALIWGGLRLWPGVFAGALLVNIWAGLSPLVAMSIATGNTLEALFAAWALCHWRDFQPSLERLRDVANLLAFGAILSAAISATIGSFSLFLSGIMPLADWARVWRVWWVGDALGVLVVAPLILAFTFRPRWRHKGLYQPAVLLLCGSVVGLILLGNWWNASLNPTAITYLVFPLLIWSTSSFGQRGSAVAVTLGSFVTTLATQAGIGPFTGGDPTENLLDKQSFMAAIAITSLILGAIISERGNKEAQVQESEHALSESQRLTHIGSWQWDVACDRITWSDELYRIYGLNPDHGDQQFGDFLSFIASEDRERVEQITQSSLFSHLPFTFEERIRRPNGEIRNLLSNGCVVLNAAGRVERMFGTCRDITEQKRSEQELKQKTEALLEANSHNEAVLSSLAEGLLLVSKDGQVLRSNGSAHRILGLRESDMVKQSCESLLRLPRTCAPMTNQLVVIEKPGGLACDLRVNVVALASGQRVITFRDVTREEEINRLKTDFISLASHELRTPIAIMKGYLDLLLIADTLHLSLAERTRMLRSVQRQGDRLSHLVDDLLNATRIEQGRFPVHPSPLSIESLLRRLQQDLQPHADTLQTCLRLWLSPDPTPWVMADPTHVAQILTNLIDNALKYAPPGQIVDLSVHHAGQFVTVAIKDQGIGIPKQEWPHLFSKFHRIDTPSMYRQRGTGLGLYISRQLAELQAGILLASSEPGIGSTFGLVLPIAPKQKEPPAWEAHWQAA